MSNFVPEFIESGETDLSGFNVVQKEAIIREYFADLPWVVTFALDMQGVTYVTDLDDIERDATDSFQGEWDDLEDFTASVIESAYEDVLEALPSFIRYHIDFDAIGRDMEMSGEISTYDTDNGNGIYVFNTSW